MPPQVFLDANVLIQAPLRDTILRAAERGFIEVRWRRAILAEVQRNLVRAGLTDEQRATRLVQTLLVAFPHALVTGFEDAIRLMTNHSKDRHVLAAAVHARVNALITLNLADFPDSSTAAQELLVLSPDSLLTSLFSDSPELVLEILVEQAADLIAPPITVEDVLVELEQSAPAFVRSVRVNLYK